MKVKPKEIFVNLPTVLLLESEDKAGEISSNVNAFIHGKVHMKYDVLGVLGGQTVVIFYLQRNDEFHSLRNQFMDLIDHEENSYEQILDLVEESHIVPELPNDEELPNNFFLSKEQMSKLTTQRLLAYKKKLYKYPEGPDWETDDNMNKSRPEWQEAYKNIKEVLSSREHVERKC